MGWCSKKFNPWKYHKINAYCSKACSNRALMARINGQDVSVNTPLPTRIADNTTLANTVISELDKSDENENDEIGTAWLESGEHWDKVGAWYAERQAAERKRATQRDSVYSTLASEGRTITLAGYGTRLMVKQDYLVIVNGRTHSTQELQQEILYRGIHGVSSIVWLTNGGPGALSIAALKWCASQNITVRILTNRGNHLATINPDPDAPQALGIPDQENGRIDVHLRRAQYGLEPSGKDIPLARLIVLRKLVSQRKCLDLHPELPDRERAYTAIEIAITWLSLDTPTPATSNLDGIRLYEARAANAYFMAWRGLPLQVDTKAAQNWPPTWKTIAERYSPLTRWMSPRQATNPAQAMLNFCYSMLESQVRAALYAIGADPACGVLHAIRNSRDSLVFDIMEPLRGEVDHLLPEFIRTHTFSMGDFNTQVSGMVTIHPALCRVLAEMVRITQRRADDEARWLILQPQMW